MNPNASANSAAANEISAYARVGAKLVDAGFSAIPCAPGLKVPGDFRRSEWRRMSDWTRYADRLPTSIETDFWDRWPDAGVCIVLGGAPDAVDHVVAVDVDTTAERVIEAIRHILPPDAVERTGSKGYAALYRASPSLASATFDVDGQRAVDFLALGRQLLVPPTVHPTTGRPYVYTSMSKLEDLTPADLPRLPDDFVERMREALGPFGEVRHNVDRRFRDDDDNDYCGPWSETNSAALDNLDAWLPPLGIQAERERDGSYRGPAVWRGGDNPTCVSYDHRGIRDFKMNEGLTPIDVVRRAGVADTDWNADDWLRQKLGMPVLQRVKFTFGPLFGREFAGVISIPYSEGAWKLRGEVEADARANIELIRDFSFDGEQPVATKMLIDRLLPDGCVGFNGGQSGVGKSFLMVHGSTCLATGNPFFGHDVYEPVGSVILAAEGSYTMPNRTAVARFASRVDGCLPIAWTGKVPNLAMWAMAKTLVPKLREVDRRFLGEHGVRMGAIWVDTLGAACAIGDEDDNSEAERIAAVLRALSAELGVSVIANHHYGKHQDTGLRGASAWRAAADFVWSATGDRNHLTGTIKNRLFSLAKSRDDEEGPISAFDLRFHQLGMNAHDKPFGSCYVVEGGEGDKEIAGGDKSLGRARRGALLDAYTLLACDVAPSGGHNGRPVRKVSLEAVRKLLKDRGQPFGDSDQEWTKATTDAFSRGVRGLKEDKIITEKSGLIWRIDNS